MSFLIRTAHPEDVAAIAAVHTASWNARYSDLSSVRRIDPAELPQQKLRWTRRLQEAGGGRFVLVAVEAETGAIAGILSAGPCRSRRLGYQAEIYALYVAPWQWRNRLGLRLMASAGYRLSLFGFQNIMLWALEDNLEARAFYERLGGQEIGGMVEQYQDASLREIGYGWDRVDRLITVCTELTDPS